MDRAAHHPKSDVPTEHELHMAHLQWDWRMRQQQVQAGTFAPVDPRAPRAAEKAARHFARRLHRAGIFLAGLAARRRDAVGADPQRVIEVTGRRALFHVINGGRR